MIDETHKLAIAAEYLDTAAALWLHEVNHFSAMHLAGAAEEISGKACRIAGLNANYDELRLQTKRALSALGISHAEQRLRDAVYGAKNAIKHMDSRSDTTVGLDVRSESATYIGAAYRNFERLGLQEHLSYAVKRVVDAGIMRIEVDV